MNPELCRLLRNGGVVSCYLADSSGSPLSPFNPSGITCTLLDGREDVETVLPNGQEVTLQKVWIKKTGYIVVQVTNDAEQCVSDPIPFCIVENALLCAPQGTDIICQVRDFQCTACINCQNGLYQSVEIFLDICLDVQVVADAVIEIPSEPCQPRDPLTIEPCSTEQIVPPRCDLFLNQRQTQTTHDSLPSSTTKGKIRKTGLGPAQLETVCVNTERVYDWITQQSRVQLRKNADDAPFICNICTLNLFVPAITICERRIFGTLECNGERVEGALIDFSSSPDIVTFSPDPAVTDENGNFTTIITVPEGTDLTLIRITASTTENGEFLSRTIPTIARCLADPCILTLFGRETIDCNGTIIGRVRCGNTFIPGVEVTLTASPPIVTFNPNPVITGENGNYFSGVVVPAGTTPTDVEITASATVEGELLTETITVNVACDKNCDLTLNADALITCEGEITGVLTCDGSPVEGAMIEFSTFPSIGTFSPNPATTMADGSFTTTLTIPEGTPLLSSALIAGTTTNGETITAIVGVQVECPPVDECPCKFRIGVDGGAAPTSVDIMTGGMASTLTGTINVTAVQCFTAAPMCNPASDNFNVSFDSGGNTINFLAGRRIEIDCEGNTFARVRGTARATGNVLPSGIYEVTITRGLAGGLALWTVNATDFNGNTFSTTFTANINPVTFIGDCTDVP